MKKTDTFKIVLFYFLLSFISINAQKNFVITYNHTFLNADKFAETNDIPKKLLEPFKNQKFIRYKSGSNFKQIVTNNTTKKNITVHTSKQVIELDDVFGNPSGYTISKKELNKILKNQPKKYKKIDYNYTKEETIILGYKCYKTIITTIDTSDVKDITTVWITKKIKDVKPLFDEISTPKGFALKEEYLMNVGTNREMHIELIATDIQKGFVNDSLFKIDTVGYKMMNYIEFKKRIK